MKIFLDENFGITNINYEETTQDSVGYNIIKCYVPSDLVSEYDSFGVYYAAVLPNSRKVGYFALVGQLTSDETGYTLYKASLHTSVVSVAGVVQLGFRFLYGDTGDTALTQKTTPVIQFPIRKSVSVNNDILILDNDQDSTDVLQSYKNLLETALATYVTIASLGTSVTTATLTATNATITSGTVTTLDSDTATIDDLTVNNSLTVGTRESGSTTGTKSTTLGYKNTASANYTVAEGLETVASGLYAHAEGYRTTASNTNAHAEGVHTTASGAHSHAENYYTTASGPNSHAEGNITTASNYHAHAEGSNTVASGNSSHAEGAYTEAREATSHAEGYYSVASNDSSHAEGIHSTSSGVGGHAEGYYTTVSESHAHAEGNYTTASGPNSHAEGDYTTASASHSHAEGSNTQATGNSSHAENAYNEANGGTSHAEGYYTKANADSSHTEGVGTIANGVAQHVSGKYNVADSTSLEIIGNGTADNARSNARKLDASGNETLAGDLIYNGSTSLSSKVSTIENNISTLKSVQNVIDVVATYADLSSVTDMETNDKVQVIADENHSSASTIYKWNGSSWVYVGAFGGNSYTKAETDTLLDAKANQSTTYTKTQTDNLLSNKADLNGSASEDFATNDLTVGGDASVSGTATVTGNATFGGTVNATGVISTDAYMTTEGVGGLSFIVFDSSNSNKYISSSTDFKLYTNSGDLTFFTSNGTIYFGDGSNNKVVFQTNTTLDSDIIPYSDSTRNLGSSSKKFANVYADNITTLENNLAEAQREIENLKQASLGNIMQEATYSGTAYEYSLDSATMPNGYLLKVGGMSYKNNQLVQNGNFESTSGWYVYGGSSYGTFAVSDNEGTITYTQAISSGNYNYGLARGITLDSTHTYVFSFSAKASFTGTMAIEFGGATISGYSASVTTTYAHYYVVSTPSSSNLIIIKPQGSTIAVDDTLTFKNFMLIDLTAIYGSGNEPSTYAEFIADFPRYSEYVPYSTGEILDTAVTSVTNRGANLWDEEWELGTILTSTGENSPSTTQIRSVNYIPVRPSTTYYNKGYAITVYRYDANKTFLGYSTVQVGTFTLDADTYYIRFWRTATTYNNDIMIVKGSTAPSAYLPYRASITKTIPTAVQNLSGYGQGISSSVCNYIDTDSKTFVKMVGRVDLGSLSWAKTTYFASVAINDIKAGVDSVVSNALCAKYGTLSYIGLSSNNGIAIGDNKRIYVKDTNYNDAESFKTAMSGVYLYYELATPVSTDISSYLGDDFDLLTNLEGNGTLVFSNTNEQKATYGIFTYEKL